jgi:hypothetical protein
MHARGGFVGGAVAAAVGLALHCAPAYADGTGDAWTDGANIAAQAATSEPGGESRGGTGGARSNCSWERLDPHLAGIADDMAEGGIGRPRGEGPGSWYRRICYSPEGFSTATLRWVGEAVDVAALAQQAADRVRIPAPAMRLNPSPAQGAVVHVETWLWVDPASWQSISAQASAGAVVVTATARPIRVTWDMGNGDRVTCEGPGTPYDRGRPSSEQVTNCSYTYRESSAGADGGAFTVTGTVVWDVTWTAAGAAGGGSLGTAPRSHSIRLPVKEIQAVNR